MLGILMAILLFSSYLFLLSGYYCSKGDLIF
jgi:hypothetical protein